MESSQPCTNGFQYSVGLSKTGDKGATLYCEDGSITRLDLADQYVVSLQVQPNAQVKSLLFQASAGPLSKSTVTLLSGGSYYYYLTHKVAEVFSKSVCRLVPPSVSLYSSCSL